MAGERGRCCLNTMYQNTTVLILVLFKHYVSEYQSRYWCCLNTMYQNTTVSILVLFKHYVSEYHSLNIGVVQTLYIRIPVSILVLFKHCIISEYHNLNISDTFTYFACLLLFLLTFKGAFKVKGLSSTLKDRMNPVHLHI